jgi:hypothetical protein
MSGRTIVMVSDLDDAKHGEINVLDDPQQAARLVESLLESGFDQTRIRIFSGDEMAMQVTHRPVVALVGSGVPSNGRHAGPEAEPVEAEAQFVIAEPDQAEESVAAPRTRSRQPVAAAATREEPTPFMRDGVKFSSLFRPA